MKPTNSINDCDKEPSKAKKTRNTFQHLSAKVSLMQQSSSQATQKGSSYAYQAYLLPVYNSRKPTNTYKLDIKFQEEKEVSNQTEIAKVRPAGKKKESAKILKCDQCERTFLHRQHFNYHIKSHKGDKQFECTKVGCSDMFYTAQQRDVHVRTHTEEKPFVCKLCLKSFLTLQNLQNHTRTHTGEKPFACRYEGCNKSFAEKSTLKKHIITHTKEKPYICKHCEKGFTQSSTLQSHIRRYHMENPPLTRSIANLHAQQIASRLMKEKLLASETNGTFGNVRTTADISATATPANDNAKSQLTEGTKLTTEGPMYITYIINESVTDEQNFGIASDLDLIIADSTDSYSNTISTEVGEYSHQNISLQKEDSSEQNIYQDEVAEQFNDYF